MAVKPDPLTLMDYQAILSEQIQRIRDGETTPANANAVTNAVSVVLRSVKLQMDYYRMTGKTPDIPLLNSGVSES